MTLIELAVASFISLVILGATLTAFTSLVSRSTAAERQTEIETRARQGVDRLARQLRNLASPADVITSVTTSTQPKSVDRNLPYDIVFKDIADSRPAGSLNSANVRRVRYCLQTAGAVPGSGFSASPARGVLWAQTQTWTTALPPAMPGTTDCPGTGWTTQQIAADYVTNRNTAPERALFRYTGDSGLVTATTDDARERISRVEATVIVDEDTLREPQSAQLTSSVILRNQNRAPIARFTFTLLNPLLTPTTCSVQLNGSASEDPESKPLEYEWVIDGTHQTGDTGVVLQKSLPKGTHSFTLNVYDRARLRGTLTETHSC